MHLRGKTYIPKERVKVREIYKTRVIRAPRLKIYSKVLPPSLLFLSSVAPQKFGQTLPARNIYTHTRGSDRCLQKPPQFNFDAIVFLSLCSSLFLSLSLFVWSKTMMQTWI